VGPAPAPRPQTQTISQDEECDGIVVVILPPENPEKGKNIKPNWAAAAGF